MIKIEESVVFPCTAEAYTWARKKYPDADKYRVEFRFMHGVGTRALIFEVEQEGQNEIN